MLMLLLLFERQVQWERWGRKGEGARLFNNLPACDPQRGIMEVGGCMQANGMQLGLLLLRRLLPQLLLRLLL